MIVMMVLVSLLLPLMLVMPLLQHGLSVRLDTGLAVAVDVFAVAADSAATAGPAVVAPADAAAAVDVAAATSTACATKPRLSFLSALVQANPWPYSRFADVTCARSAPPRPTTGTRHDNLGGEWCRRPSLPQW